MIIPSVDIQNGNAVQLIGGKKLEINAGDPVPLARNFGRTGEVAVIDLDAAMGHGDNTEVINALLKVAPCRVGGGIRSYEKAMNWLDRGASKIILGTAAKPELLQQLPKGRLIAALDGVDGEVVVHGWKTKTGLSVLDRLRELSPYVFGFLVTFVEREGRLVGIDFDHVQKLKEAAGEAQLTVAGGIATPAEIAKLHDMGIDAQVGMALYKGHFDVADVLAEMLNTDRADGLFTTVVVDEWDRALGLVYSTAESLKEALKTGTGVYYSRSRKEIWRKGSTSGAIQELLDVRLDCDADALLFRVKQAGRGFCHLERFSCWDEGRGLKYLESTLLNRKATAPEGSYTARLYREPDLLAAKIREEVDELVAAEGTSNVVHEAADLLYFTMVRLAAEGISFSDVVGELDRRSRKVSRRGGDAKPGYLKT
ncbi:MAG: phosphoribosyl-ATP diphosphatase [Myxococcota bacterium]|nr:phosphoribosyl-ATP diphosphatase [Myxococcota bacterium]